MKSEKYLISFIMFFALVQTCSASFIGISVSMRVPDIITSSSFPINLSIVNTGDEAAHDVQASLVLPEGMNMDTVYVGTMEPNVPYMYTLNVNVSDNVTDGTYPIVVKIHYADANAYPFSTVSPSYLRIGKAVPITLRGSINEISLSGDAEKDLVLEVVSQDEKPKRVHVKFNFPDELKAGFYSTDMDLDATGSGKVSVPVKSFGALPGSNYIVFAALEYEQDALHYGSFASGMVKITAKEESPLTKILPPSVLEWIPITILALLLLAFIYFQIKK